MFQNRTLYIATKHGKEEAIGPVFAEAFELRFIVPPELDTDALGTFSGEVERHLSPEEAAREKCRMVAAEYGADLVIASEGSFGPHPVLGFVPVDAELLMLKDLKNDLEISVTELSLSVNFGSTEVASCAELLAFAARFKFPSHGLILKGHERGRLLCFKGITDEAALIHYFGVLKRRCSKVLVETDMRALFNPTRMEVIGQAAQKLAARVKCLCPACQKPGFGVVKAIPGLPCSECGLPTRSVKVHLLQCQPCGHREEVLYPNGNQFEEPMYCDFCNP